MVTTGTCKPSLVRIDACNFELSWKQTHPQTHRQDRLQYTVPQLSMQCNKSMSVCWLTLSIGMLAESCHTHTQYIWLDRRNYQEHVHAWVCSALTDSVLGVSWHNARFWLLGDGIWAHSAACSFRDETSPDPTMDDGLCLHVQAWRRWRWRTLILPRRLCSAVLCSTRWCSRFTSCNVGVNRTHTALNCTGCNTPIPALCRQRDMISLGLL